jgi:hypothetical protein
VQSRTDTTKHMYNASMVAIALLGRSEHEPL